MLNLLSIDLKALQVNSVPGTPTLYGGGSNYSAITIPMKLCKQDTQIICGSSPPIEELVVKGVCKTKSYGSMMHTALYGVAKLNLPMYDREPFVLVLEASHNLRLEFSNYTMQGVTSVPIAPNNAPNGIADLIIPFCGAEGHRLRFSFFLGVSASMDVYIEDILRFEDGVLSLALVDSRLNSSDLYKIQTLARML